MRAKKVCSGRARSHRPEAVEFPADIIQQESMSKASFRFRAVLLVLALALAFVSLETALRLWWPQEITTEGPPRFPEDTKMGRAYTPGGRYLIHMPDRTVELKFNSEGLRDTASHPVPKPSGVFRVLLVGDSFTMGADNQYDEIWPVLLERTLLQKGYRVDIINAGIESFDTGSELIMMRRLVPKYHPDLVLTAFLPNDIFDNRVPDAAPHAAFATATQAGMSFIDFQSLYLFKRILLRNDFVYTGAYWMTSRRQYFTETQTRHAAEQYAATRELLSRASQYASTEGSRFAVASIPQCFQVLAKARNIRLPGLAADVVDSRLGQFAAQRGFPWLPSLGVLAAHYSAHGEDLYYRLDGHFTPLGNRIFGEWLVGEVLRVYGPNLPTERVR